MKMNQSASLNTTDYRGRINLDYFDTISIKASYIVATQNLVFFEKINIGNILLALGRMQIAKNHNHPQLVSSLRS